jgi:hypothetical protein
MIIDKWSGRNTNRIIVGRWALCLNHKIRHYALIYSRVPTVNVTLSNYDGSCIWYKGKFHNVSPTTIAAVAFWVAVVCCIML